MGDYYPQLLDESIQAYVIGILVVMLVIWVGAAVGLSFIPASMAKKKGYTFAGFYCMSLFISFVITIIIAALITDKNPKPRLVYMPYGPQYGPYPPYGPPLAAPPPYGPPPVAPPPYAGAPPMQQPANTQSQTQDGSPAANAAYYPPRCPNCREPLTSNSDYCARCGMRVK